MGVHDDAKQAFISGEIRSLGAGMFLAWIMGIVYTLDLGNLVYKLNLSDDDNIFIFAAFPGSIEIFFIFKSYMFFSSQSPATFIPVFYIFHPTYSTVILLSCFLKNKPDLSLKNTLKAK